MRILLVEDHEPDAILVREYLRQIPGPARDLDWVDTWEDGLRWMKRRVHDVYLVDHLLGARDGVDLIGAALRAGVRAPMILLTGMRDRSLDIRATEAGAADYLVKGSVDAEQLERSLRYAVQRDLDRVALERRAEELARSNAELEQFAAAVSHDLRGPLQVAMGRLELLVATTDLEAKAQRHVDLALETVLHMEELIEDLLAYARVGSTLDQFEPVPLAAVVDGVLHELDDVVSHKGARVERSDLPTVVGSRVQLEQLMRNLLGNALKFSKEQRPLIQIGAGRHNGLWTVSIQDNGLGFDGRYAEQVFGLFQRLRVHRDIPGTGLGLAICRKVVENHGGRIWAEGTPGEGATFHFTLPWEGKEGRPIGAACGVG